MPLSRADLHEIVEAIRDLYRIVADPSPTPRNMKVFESYSSAFPITEGPPQTSPSPAGLIYAGEHWVLRRLQPTAENSFGGECPDIDDADTLTLAEKKSLRDLRERLSSRDTRHILFWPGDLLKRKSVRDNYLLELQAAIDALSGVFNREERTKSSTGGKKKSRKGIGGAPKKIYPWAARLLKVLTHPDWANWVKQYEGRTLDYDRLAQDVNRGSNVTPATPKEIQEYFKRKDGEDLITLAKRKLNNR